MAGSFFDFAVGKGPSACLAEIWGDFPAELDLGVAGGGMSTSEMGSGEIESASELSWLYGSGSLLMALVAEVTPAGFVGSAFSMMVDISFGVSFEVEPCFLRCCDFIIGDCFTDLEADLGVGTVFRRDFRNGPVSTEVECPPSSGSKSIGEVVSEVSELRIAFDLGAEEGWPARAGDVKGLKLSPGA